MTGRHQRRRRVSDAGKVLDRVVGKDADLRRRVEAEKLNVLVAEMIHQVRTAAGLTQAELARLVGTTQSVISRLEDADYEGHSLSMLQRIASALHRKLEVRFVPRDARRKIAKGMAQAKAGELVDGGEVARRLRKRIDSHRPKRG